MATTVLAMPDVGVEKDGTELLAAANAIVVNDQASRAVADEIVIQTDRELKGIHKILDPFVALAWQGHKKAVAYREAYLGPRELGRRIAAGKITAFQQEEEREHRKEQARLDAIARKHVEEEQLQRAEELEAQGRKAEAEAVIAAPIIAPVVWLPPPPKSGAVTAREYWRAIVVNKSLLPAEWLIPNESELNKFAQRTKGAIAIPGVVFEKEIRGAMKPRR